MMEGIVWLFLALNSLWVWICCKTEEAYDDISLWIYSAGSPRAPVRIIVAVAGIEKVKYVGSAAIIPAWPDLPAGPGIADITPILTMLTARYRSKLDSATLRRHVHRKFGFVPFTLYICSMVDKDIRKSIIDLFEEKEVLTDKDQFGLDLVSMKGVTISSL